MNRLVCGRLALACFKVYNNNLTAREKFDSVNFASDTRSSFDKIELDFGAQKS